jgi:hypothetical protein
MAATAAPASLAAVFAVLQARADGQRAFGPWLAALFPWLPAQAFGRYQMQAVSRGLGAWDLRSDGRWRGVGSGGLARSLTKKER